MRYIPLLIVLAMCVPSLQRTSVKECYACSGSCSEDEDIKIETCSFEPHLNSSIYACFAATFMTDKHNKYTNLKMCILADDINLLIMCEAANKAPGGYCGICFKDLCNSATACKTSLLIYGVCIYFLAIQSK